MADKKEKKISVEFSPEEIMGIDISKSGDYKYARVGIKKGENERMSIYHEWMGEGIPDLVMNLMGHMKSNKEEMDAQLEITKDEYASLKERLVK